MKIHPSDVGLAIRPTTPPTRVEDEKKAHSTPPRRCLLAFVVALLMVGACLGSRAHAAAPAVERRVYIAEADGTEQRLLSDNLQDYDFQGSPDWSPAGKLIAIDAWRTSKGEGMNDAWIVVVEADSGDVRVLIDGAIPSFSPGGHRIVFSRYGSNRGVWVMNSEGPEEGLALIDKKGWCAVWSPDGRKIAYVKSTSQGANFVILNVVEGTRRLVFDEVSSPYSTIYWNFAWSPDSTRLVFNASRGGKAEVAIVDVRGAKHGLTTRLPGNLRTSFSWRPDGKRILFFKHDPKHGTAQLFLLDPETKTPAKRLGGQNPKWRHIDTSYAPDGSRFAVSIKKNRP